MPNLSPATAVGQPSAGASLLPRTGRSRLYLRFSSEDSDPNPFRQHARFVNRPLAGKHEFEALLDLAGVAGGDPRDDVVGAWHEDVKGLARRELDR